METSSVAVSVLVMAVSVTVLVGWLLPAAGFRSAWPAMNPMVACSFLAASVSLLLLRGAQANQTAVWIGQGLAMGVLAIGTVKLLTHLLQLETGIDSWLFARELAARSEPGNYIALRSAFAMVLVGGALLLLRRAAAYRTAEILSFIVLAIGTLCTQGYAFGLLELHSAPGFVPMSLWSGLGFMFLGTAMLLARTERGAMGLIASNTAGGLLARRLIPMAIILPIALGSVRLAGEKAGWYDTSLGVALFTTADSFLFLALIGWTARLLHRSDRTRQAAERATNESEKRVQRLNVELEQRIAERTSALEAATAANHDLEAFSYSVSHDLRAPLRAINGFSRIVLEEHASALEAEGLRYLHQVQSSAVQMGQLVDDLLTFSRTSRQQLSAQAVDMRDLVEKCLAELRSTHEGRRVEITLAALPPAKADPPLLKQLWLNLLSNALKYSRRSDPARITIGSRSEGAEVIYFVQDNGAGFDMNYADKLFNVFQRLHLADDYEGTGVGLALVQRIVQRHGGRVWAEALVDRGATFFFTLEGSANV